MNYGYARVSTVKQGNGNSLEEQLNSLFDAGCDRVVEEKFTAKNNDRPQLKELLNILKPGDTFTATKLDRFARSTIEGSNLVQDLIERGIKVHILNIGIMDNTPASKLIRHIFLAFAEFERDMIVERTSAGKAVAKAKNPDWREGRKRVDISEKEFQKFLKMQKGGKITVEAAIAQMGISRSTWYARVREVG